MDGDIVTQYLWGTFQGWILWYFLGIHWRRHGKAVIEV